MPAPLTRRPLGRRILRIATRLLGAVVVVVALALGFLHTRWGKSFVRGRIEAKLAAAIDGEVTLGSVDYTFLFGEVRLGELEIRDPTGRRAIAVASLTADLDRMSVIRGAPLIHDLELEGVAVSIVQTADGRSNLTGLVKPSDREPLERIRIARLAIAGTATVTKPDGTSIAVRELHVAGSLDARPAAHELDVVLARLGAKLAISRPGAADRELELAIDSATLGRRRDAIDVDVKQLAAGALTIEALGAHLRLAGGQLHGAQSITIAKARVDRERLAAVLGRPLLLDDVAVDATVSGTEDKLAIHGTVRTGGATLTLDGTADVSAPARPRYALALVGRGRTQDVVAGEAIPRVETDLRVDLTGAGITAADLDATLTLAIGPTTIGSIRELLAGGSSGAPSGSGRELVAGGASGAPAGSGRGLLPGGASPAPSGSGRGLLPGGASPAPSGSGRGPLPGGASPAPSGSIAVERITAKAIAHHGAYRLDHLELRGLGFELVASGALAADHAVTGRLAVGGDPVEAIRVLGAAGIAIPRKVPLLHRLDLAVTATGNLDGVVAVELAPSRIAIAGGAISVAGSARLDHRVVTAASTQIGLHQLDLGKLAALAGRPPTALGSISGTLDLTRTRADQRAAYDLAIALREPALAVVATGSATATSATTRVEVVRARDRTVLGTVNALLPLDRLGVRPSGAWQVAVELARRPVAELRALLPERLRGRLPAAGDLELHAALSGTPSQPTGSIRALLGGGSSGAPSVSVDLAVAAATLPRGSQPRAPDGPGVAVVTKATVRRVGRDQPPIAIVDGTVAMPPLFAGRKLDVARLRAATTVDATIELPERELASLSDLRANLAELGGKVGGRITVTGPLATPALDAKLRWHGYGTASGGPGETTLAVAGSPTTFTATLVHNRAVAIVADIDRRADRIAIHARANAGQTPLLPLIPRFAAGKLSGNDPGRLRWDMDGRFTLVPGPAGLALDQASVTGSLDIQGGAIAIPHTDRRWHDIGLELVCDPRGLRLKSLALHETDLEQRDRRLFASGLLAFDDHRPHKLSLALAARDWLVFGTPTFGPSDAPRAAADFDLGVEIDLAAPIVAIDATVNSLALRAPDRLDRGHQAEVASVAGDIIFVDPSTGAPGKLPVTPPSRPAAPRPRRPIDVRIHIPKPIRLNQTPFDVMAHGELAVTVRDRGVEARGGLTMDRGSLLLFGRAHELVAGSLTFSDQHPSGWLALTFERRLPDAAMRELATASGGARVTFTGSPTKPKTTLGGAANAALAEVMAMYNAGRPVHVSRPGLPASATVEAPRGDQLFMLTYMASNLPHLLFLDRISAWADPYQPDAGYGQIRNLEAERYARDQRSRIRAVVRPPTPGRSSAELHYDRMWINNDRAAFGVGLRAGDRGGGGVGLFLEWSSEQ